MAEKLNSNIFASFKNIKEEETPIKKGAVSEAKIKEPKEVVSDHMANEQTSNVSSKQAIEKETIEPEVPEEKVVPSIALNIFDKKPPRKTNVTSITLTDKASENWKKLAGQYGVSKNEFINQLLESLIEDK